MADTLLDGISVVVPVYNSESSLTPLVDRLHEVLPRLASEWEVILVNDGSRDRSWETIERLARAQRGVHGIDLARNYGQHNAVVCGVRAARFPIIVTIDDDLQHPPEEIPRLLARLNEGYDVVYGTPQKEQHGLWRDLASRIIKWALQSAMGVDAARDISAFRAIRLEARDAFDSYRSPYVSVDVLLTWQTTKFGSVRVAHDPRAAGRSQYTALKLIVHALNMLTGFSTWPLRFASVVGLFFTLFGVGVLVYVLARYFINGVVVPGFAFLASTIAIFSGAQLFTIGIIGEYLARLHFRMMGKPLYVVRSSTSPGGQPDE
jgi:glycosyltransferase involved in cell wall biosynthesis